MGGSRPLSSAAYGRGGGSWVWGLVLLLVLVVGFAVGMGIDRFLLQGPSASGTHGRASTAGVPGVGPSRVVQGIPVGYPHTPEGAAQAAGNYLAVLGGQLALDPGQLKAALDQVAEPSARVRLEQSTTSSLQVEESLWGIQSAAQEGKHVLLMQTPIAYKVDTYTPDEATVSVWLVANVGVENRQRLVAFFGVGSATLAWLDGDWRLRNVDAGSQAGDVVPASLQTPTATGGVPSKLDGFVPYGR